MPSLVSTWTALDLRRRAAVIGATLAVFLAVLALARMGGQTQMALLYAGLDGRAAGEVVAALDQRGVAYEVQGDAIRVDAKRRDELRMALAGEGLPTAGSAGYELLDGMSGFGTTAQMFDAAYWRAREGELARTIQSVPGIRAVRVHLAQAPAAPFQPDRKPTASVTVTTAGGTLPATQARALRHLVAAAVPGMRPEDVAVIDSVAGLLPDEEDGLLPGASEGRAAELKKSVERLLAARVGPGGAIVEVSLEVQTEREQLTERRFDPQGRVAISSETETRANTATDPGGEVTVASNLPTGDAAAGAAGKSQSNETRERVNYEVSESQRELLRMPGAVKRMTVAVLIDEARTTGADGTVTVAPRAEAELNDLRDLVASAVGFDEARGDVLTVKSMPFDAPLPPAGPAMGSTASALAALDMMTLIQLGVLALVAVVLGIFVVRPILTSGSRPLLDAQTPPLALPEPQGAGGLRVLTGEIDDGEGPAFRAQADGELPSDPVERLRRLIEARQSESVEILRGWMEREGETG